MAHEEVIPAHDLISSSPFQVLQSVSIGEIALAVGYANASKFSSAFREATGFTPSEYRASAPSEI